MYFEANITIINEITWYTLELDLYLYHLLAESTYTLVLGFVVALDEFESDLREDLEEQREVVDYEGD